VPPDETRPKTLKAADLRGIASLAADGKLAPGEASRIIEQCIAGDRVKASLQAIRDLHAYITDPKLYGAIESAYRKKNKLPSFELDKATAEASIESQLLAEKFQVIPAGGKAPVSLCTVLNEYKLRLDVRLVRPRPPGKRKKLPEGAGK
jgi:hypothetical protein